MLEPLSSSKFYDPETNNWTQSDNRLVTRRWGHSSNVVDGKIYVMGGATLSRDDGSDTIEVYELGTAGWVEKGRMTPGRIGYRTCEFNGKIYVSGGEYEEPSLSVLDLVDAYAPPLKHGNLLHLWHSPEYSMEFAGWKIPFMPWEEARTIPLLGPSILKPMILSKIPGKEEPISSMD